MTDINISLLIPGYLSPSRQEGHTFGQDVASCPAAMQWRATDTQLPWQVSLFRLLTLTESAGLCLPAAELMHADFPANEFIVRADPVHLQADRDTAKLLPLQMLELDENESETLIIALNQFLSADGLNLFRGPDHGWFMTGMDASNLESYPPSFLANRNASAFLPSGEGSERWRRLMTEIQMLLHTHPVNETRMQQGKLPINSLWFWGGAKLSAIRQNVLANTKQHCTVYADDEFSAALCAQLGLQCLSLEQFDPMTPQDVVIVDTRIASAHFARNEMALKEATSRVNSDWLVVLTEQLRQGRISQISISNEDGEVGQLSTETQKAYDRAQSFWGRQLMGMQRWFSRG